MTILEKLVSVFAPHVCLGCAAEDDLLICEQCSLGLATIPSRCYRCFSATRGFTTCPGCQPYSGLEQVIVAYQYAGLPKRLVRATKYDRAQVGTVEMAHHIADQAKPVLQDDVLLVHIPTATARVRTRGYDHARLLAKGLSEQLGMPHAAVLARVGQAHQVGSSREKRLKQLRGAFRVTKPLQVTGANIVLVDDVLTTGASLEAAAKVLLDAGAATVSAVVFAQADAPTLRTLQPSAAMLINKNSLSNDTLF